jgi:ABC-type uncharacterized transport system permease subunit
MEEFVVATLRYGAPLVYVTMAGVLAQRAGVWNLGLEGLMIIGCCASVLGLDQTGSLLFGVILAVVLCVIASALLWFVIEELRANPIIAGLGLTGLGLGGTDLGVQRFTAATRRSTRLTGCRASVPHSASLACSLFWSPPCRSLSSACGLLCEERVSAFSFPLPESTPSQPEAWESVRRACA